MMSTVPLCEFCKPLAFTAKVKHEDAPSSKIQIPFIPTLQLTSQSTITLPICSPLGLPLNARPGVPAITWKRPEPSMRRSSSAHQPPIFILKSYKGGRKKYFKYSGCYSEMNISFSSRHCQNVAESACCVLDLPVGLEL